MGKGAYDAAVDHPAASALIRGSKVISLETLEAHAAEQNVKLERIAARFDALASGGG